MLPSDAIPPPPPHRPWLAILVAFAVVCGFVTLAVIISDSVSEEGCGGG